jgi:uncharacterized protein (DUF58 family)
MALMPRTVLVALVLAVGLAAFPGDLGGSFWWALLIVNVALLAVAVVDALVAPRVASFEVRRALPAVVVAGERATVSWTVRNPTRRRVRVGVADELPPSLNAGRRRSWMTLRGGEAGTSFTRIEPERRGRFRIDAVSLRVVGPLGLGARQSRVPVPGVVRVHPPFRSRKDAELRIRTARQLEIGLRSAHGTGGGSEFEQLREYSADDEFRSIDWGATARVGRAIVRTYRPERNQTVLVLLDSGRLSAARVDDVPRIEHAMDGVMMLGAVATRLGDKVGLVVFDADVRSIVPAARHQHQVTRMTEAMFDVEPALAESDYRGAFTALLARFRRRSLVVVLTELAPQAVEERIVPALPLLLRRHLVVVAAVRDPQLVEWADAGPEEAGDAYLRAAALAAQTERERASARLRGMGVTVIDAPPGRFAPQLADTYLTVKSTGRL